MSTNPQELFRNCKESERNLCSEVKIRKKNCVAATKNRLTLSLSPRPGSGSSGLQSLGSFSTPRCLQPTLFSQKLKLLAFPAFYSLFDAPYERRRAAHGKMHLIALKCAAVNHHPCFNGRQSRTLGL